MIAWFKSHWLKTTVLLWIFNSIIRAMLVILIHDYDPIMVAFSLSMGILWILIVAWIIDSIRKQIRKYKIGEGNENKTSNS